MPPGMPPKSAASVLPDRRSFLAFFSGLGLTPTLFPGVLWAKLEEQKPRSITKEMLRAAAAVAGVQFTSRMRNRGSLPSGNQAEKNY